MGPETLHNSCRLLLFPYRCFWVIFNQIHIFWWLTILPVFFYFILNFYPRWSAVWIFFTMFPALTLSWAAHVSFWSWAAGPELFWQHRGAALGAPQTTCCEVPMFLALAHPEGELEMGFLFCETTYPKIYPWDEILASEDGLGHQVRVVQLCCWKLYEKISKAGNKGTKGYF